MRINDAIATLRRIEQNGCEASTWYEIEPPRWDVCLDPDYREDNDPRQEDRCPPCVAHAFLEEAQ